MVENMSYWYVNYCYPIQIKWDKLLLNNDNEQSYMQTSKLYTFLMKQIHQDYEHES